MERSAFPATLEIAYPDHELDRFSSFFRPLAVIPVCILLGLISGPSFRLDAPKVIIGSGGILFPATALMLLFRQKYPRWWYDWNLALSQFTARVMSYMALMRDEYPSTDAQPAVRVTLVYPDARTELNRWLPLVKWFLAIPHYVVMVFLVIGAVCCGIIAWFAILFTGRYPVALFNYQEGVMRWGLRVGAYAFLLTTDRYPPFTLAP